MQEGHALILRFRASFYNTPYSDRAEINTVFYYYYVVVPNRNRPPYYSQRALTSTVLYCRTIIGAIAPHGNRALEL
jgi:hypothetical protein